ncbi:MAG: Unknown protein [uncultured Sulfurovum sp.]|uniref:TonB-dependent receptor n=1 Tax=uncultured Sulfurovum sp. TaxID=269237 RepID=A0A6S6TIC1_9BACT|nr:MAG: Unknown protein [uncultured Sulfurovum sp.]
MNTTIRLSLLTTLLLNTNLSAEEKLEDIKVISATKTSQKLSEVTSNIQVITAQEIEERHYTTLTEALNTLPGVSFTSNGGLGQTSSLRLRGFDPKQTIVLIDGIRYNDVTSPIGAAFEHLLIDDIERIEVIKGAQSGIWGADAVAGVINIISKDAKKGFKLQASQEFGSFNSSSSKIGVSYKEEDFYLKASSTQIDTNGFTAQIPQKANIDDFEDDKYQNKTTNLKAGFNINATNKIDISHTVIDATNQFDGGFFPLTATQIANNNQLSSTTNDKFSSVNFNHIDSFNELNIYANHSTFERRSMNGATISAFDGSVKEYGLNSKINYLDNSFVLIGGDYKTFEHKNSIDQSNKNKALFITNNNQVKGFFAGTTILTESLRHDKYDTFNNQTTAKIGLKHISRQIEGLTASINYGTAYRIPSLTELYTPFYGNTALSPEETKSLDISLEYKDLSFTYFDNKIDNLIGFHPTTFQNINVDGTTKIKGYEIAYATTLFDILALSLNYTKLDAKDKTDSNLLRRPNNSVKFGVDYYGIERVHLGFNGEHIGNREDKDFSSFPATHVDTGKYTVANFTANYKVDKQLSFYTKIDNITDEEYQTVYGYTASPRAVYTGMKLSY